MIEVIISRLGIDPDTQSYVVVLQEKGGERLLPIWIGKTEAQAIVAHLHHMKAPRPLTHDLCVSVIVGLGATLRRAQITRLADKTYYGELHLERDGNLVRVDSRPSDALAVAVRLEAPIFAAEALLMNPADEDAVEEAGDSLTAPRDAFELTAEQLKEYLEHLRPEDFGKFNP